MLQTLENHPSIIVWILFNESWGQYDTERLAQWLKTMDPSRLVDNASGWSDMHVGDLTDMHSYPGPDCPAQDSRRAMVLGEFGGLGLVARDHCWSSRTWAYLMLDDDKTLAGKYTRSLKQVWALNSLRGLSAAIYTQTTDVETECNGLLSYDRALSKMAPDLLFAANHNSFTGPPMKPVLADATTTGRTQWKYTFEKPPDDWIKPDFDASKWKQGPGGFGTAGTPGIFINTTWDTPDIWLRAEFDLAAEDIRDLKFEIFHDEDASVYLNGVLAAQLKGFITQYDDFEISPEASRALRPGRNTIAVQCHQTSGGQGIDVGILAPQRTATPIKAGAN
jgi:hypothetical protein